MAAYFKEESQMADPVTHIFLGMGICPQRPVLGACAAMISDTMQLVAAIKLKTANIWENFPPKLRAINDELHNVMWDAAAILICVAFVQFELAHLFLAKLLGHDLPDMFTHDTTVALYPIKGVLQLGRTYHSIDNMKRGTWMIVLAMLMVSFGFSWLRGAW